MNQLFLQDQYLAHIYSSTVVVASQKAVSMLFLEWGEWKSLYLLFSESKRLFEVIHIYRLRFDGLDHRLSVKNDPVGNVACAWDVTQIH